MFWQDILENQDNNLCENTVICHVLLISSDRKVIVITVSVKSRAEDITQEQENQNKHVIADANYAIRNDIQWLFKDNVFNRIRKSCVSVQTGSFITRIKRDQVSCTSWYAASNGGNRSDR